MVEVLVLKTKAIMIIEIHKPELASGRFRSVDDLLTYALEALRAKGAWSALVN